MPLVAAVLLLLFVSCESDVSHQRPDPVTFVSIERATTLQSATLFLEGGAVARTFGPADASFVMHPDDLDAVFALLEEAKVPDECPAGDPASAPVMTVRVGSAEKRCGLPAHKEALDALLLIPERTMHWPFKPQDEPHPVGHAVNSFQDYSPLAGDEYFHPGVDIVMPENAKVYNVLPGRVVKYDYYDLSGGNAKDRMYFEVVIETVNGLVLQYHHIDPDSVSGAVKEAKQSGEILPVGAEIGFIVSWTVTETGYSNEPFHHLHLNTFTQDLLPLDGLQLLLPHPDTTPPEIVAVTLVDASRSAVLDPAAVTGDFRVVIETYDLMDDNPWPLPPRRLSVTVKDEKGKTLLERPGYDFVAGLSAVKEKFACDYYLCGDAGMASKGDYGPRRFFIEVTAFDEMGAKAGPIAVSEIGAGKKNLTVTACDEYDTCATRDLALEVP